VQDVSHGAQPDHKQAKLELRLQALIFSQGYCCSQSALIEMRKP
jgi:hypothetical protein